MYKVLHVMNGADSGGISAVVLNYYSHINKQKIHFDIAITDSYIGNNGAKLVDLGCTFYYLPSGFKNRIKYIKKLRTILIQGKYDCIHVHLNESSFYALFAGILAGTRERIAHAHVVRTEHKLFDWSRKIISKIFNPMFATKLIGCSYAAASYMFGERYLKSGKAIVLNNAINIEKFTFNMQIREEVRQELRVNNKIVIGNVGNLIYQKNHEFLIKIFSVVHKYNENTVLIIVGSGNLENELKKKAKEYKVEDSIIFTGRRSDTDRLYQAFDSFVLTSRFEGFPVSVVEAIASGLNVVIPTELGNIFSFSQVIQCSLKDDISTWYKKICGSIINPCDRSGRQKLLMDAGFDINSVVNKLEQQYL